MLDNGPDMPSKELTPTKRGKFFVPKTPNLCEEGRSGPYPHSFEPSDISNQTPHPVPRTRARVDWEEGQDADC